MNTVIYHKSDFDGIFCQEIAKHFLPDANLIGWEYGEPEPVVPLEHDLWIMDLSVPGLMDHPRLVWIDHHKSAIEKYPATIAGYRIDGVAACRLAWQWFTHDIARHVMSDPSYLPLKGEFVRREVSEPLAVRLAGEYDVWDKRDSDADLFQHGLRSQELTDSVWRSLLDKTESPDVVIDLLKQGFVVAYATQRHNDLVIGNNGFDLEWEGLKFLACNNGSYNSHLFIAGIKPHHDALLGFTMRANRKWTVSLYGAPGKPNVDLSAIAVKYGGGGHKQASGFTIEKLPFL